MEQSSECSGNLDGAPAAAKKSVVISGWAQPKADDYTAAEAGVSTQDWDGNAQIYEWKDDFGDVGPKYPELELELFGEPETRHERTGLDFMTIDQIEVSQEGPVRIAPINSFRDAGLHPTMLESVTLCGYDNPTPIQKYTIPSILQGYDVVGIAQTGSGKTAAYLIPILSRLMGKAKKLAAPRPNPASYDSLEYGVTAEPLVLIVVPTRELAVQIFNEARKFCYRTMLRPCVVYGGVPVKTQAELLKKGCDVLIGTPGRLGDFIGRPNVLTLRRLKYVVIDEADEMLGADWEEELRPILSGGEQDVGNVKFGLFSATFPVAARALAKEHLSSSHVRFRVGRAGSTTQNIRQIVIEISTGITKNEALLVLLEEMHGIRTIIFVNSRQTADTLDDYLYNMGLPITSIHSDRSQEEREAAMRTFRSGKAPILIATGVTARGIDVRNVMHVINYDLPSMDHGGIEEYVHRIGRTGRIGHRGVSTSFYTERDEPIASVLTRTLLETNQKIPEFLQVYIPEGCADGKNLKFETESDYDPNETGGAGGGESGEAWGTENAAGSDSGGAWGSTPANESGDTGVIQTTEASSGWGAVENTSSAW